MSSANLNLVRSIWADWERGDFSRGDWVYPEIEYMQVDGPEPGSWVGRAAVTEGYRDFVGVWDEFRIEVDEYRQLDNERVLVLFHRTGRGKTSGLQLSQKGAHVYHLRDGRVTRLVTYWDRDRALADLGLAREDAADRPD